MDTNNIAEDGAPRANTPPKMRAHIPTFPPGMKIRSVAKIPVPHHLRWMIDAHNRRVDAIMEEAAQRDRSLSDPEAFHKAQLGRKIRCVSSEPFAERSPEHTLAHQIEAQETGDAQ